MVCILLNILLQSISKRFKRIDSDCFGANNKLFALICSNKAGNYSPPHHLGE